MRDNPWKQEAGMLYSTAGGRQREAEEKTRAFTLVSRGRNGRGRAKGLLGYTEKSQQAPGHGGCS